jgi:hypothetical protein
VKPTLAPQGSRQQLYHCQKNSTQSKKWCTLLHHLFLAAKFAAQNFAYIIQLQQLLFKT